MKISVLLLINLIHQLSIKEFGDRSPNTIYFPYFKILFSVDLIIYFRCSEIVDLKNTKALIQCDSCRALKRNVLHKRRNPEEDPYPTPNKVKLVPQEKQALIKAINRNYDHSQNRLKVILSF